MISVFEGHPNHIGLNAPYRSNFADLRTLFIIQRKLDGQPISHLEVGNAVHRKPDAGLGYIVHLDQSLDRMALAVLKQKHAHQIDRLSKMASAFDQYPINVAAAAFTFQPHGRPGIQKGIQIPDDPLVACRTDKRTLALIINENPVFLSNRHFAVQRIVSADVFFTLYHADRIPFLWFACPDPVANPEK